MKYYTFTIVQIESRNRRFPEVFNEDLSGETFADAKSNMMENLHRYGISPDNCGILYFETDADGNPLN